MIEYKRGDILAEDVEALVNTVNCVGVMGRGIALQFKNAYPGNFKAYAAACRRGDVQPGRMFVFEPTELTNPRYIINFPTKRHWRGKSCMADIEAGLSALVQEVEQRGITSVAVPPLGCGLGGLAWSDVRARIVQAFEPLESLRIVVFEPTGAPDSARLTKRSNVPEMTPGRAALIGLMRCYLAGLMDTSVTLLEIHKLMYFMQVAGQELKLRYVKGSYGPYAENLRHVLQAIEGYFVSGYADGGDTPDKELVLVPGAEGDAAAFLAEDPGTRARFDRVGNLVEGFETPFGLELLSTVHWVADHNDIVTDEELVDRLHAWGPRKRQFSREQIRLAADVLAEKGWLPQRVPTSRAQTETSAQTLR